MARRALSTTHLKSRQLLLIRRRTIRIRSGSWAQPDATGNAYLTTTALPYGNDTVYADYYNTDGHFTNSYSQVSVGVFNIG